MEIWVVRPSRNVHLCVCVSLKQNNRHPCFFIRALSHEVQVCRVASFFFFFFYLCLWVDMPSFCTEVILDYTSISSVCMSFPLAFFFFFLHCVFPFNLVSVFFAITDLFASRKLLWNSSISLPQNTNKISDFLWLCTVDVNDRSWPKSLSDVGVTEWKRKALYSRGTLGEGENYESVITARAIRQFDFHIVKTHLGICRVLSCVKLESFCTRVWGGGRRLFV